MVLLIHKNYNITIFEHNRFLNKIIEVKKKRRKKIEILGIRGKTVISHVNVVKLIQHSINDLKVEYD